MAHAGFIYICEFEPQEEEGRTDRTLFEAGGCETLLLSAAVAPLAASNGDGLDGLVDIVAVSAVAARSQRRGGVIPLL